MNDFIFQNTTKVYFGENQLENLGTELSKYGKKVLLTYGGGTIKKIGLYDKVVAEVKKAGLELFELSGIDPNPKISSVRAGAELCKREKIDVLLAVGGGSVIDCTKYIGAGALIDEDPWNISLGKVDVKECLPIIDVLTLSATGSEMNCGGVISNPETKDKIGLSFTPMQPKASFLDPTNTFTVNKYQTACGSADILNHILEVYFNMNNGLFMLDTQMEGLMKTVIKYAPIAMNEPENYEARANLMWASSWAINGYIRSGNTHSWTCHPIEHEISAFYDITHGLGLAILTPRWLKYTLDETTVSKYYQFGVNVFGLDKNLSEMDVANKSIELLEEFFFKTLGLQSKLSDIGIDDRDFEVMANKCGSNGKLSRTFKPLDENDVLNIFKMCL